VAIIDDKGDLLAGGDDKSGADATGAEEESQTTEFEDRMRQRIESIVASIVGVGHVRVQVVANMDYKHISETSDLFDPDGKVIRSTQTTERNANESAQQNGGGNSVSVSNAVPTAQTATAGSGDPGKKSDSTSTEETTNYEISHTQRVSTTDGGQLKRLSVAVVVDGTSVTDANGKTAYTPRSKPDMAQITQLVQSAIGYDKSRGDQVEVTNMQFARLDDGPATPAPQPLLGLDGAYWFKIIEAAILGLTALLIGFFIVRPLIKRMFAPVPMGVMVTTTPIAGALPAPAAQSDGIQHAAAAPLVIPPPRESMIDIQRIDGQVRDSAIKKVGEVVQAHPEEALAILRSWLHQPV
jgi:flagellar M-ring protein FliF